MGAEPQPERSEHNQSNTKLIETWQPSMIVSILWTVIATVLTIAGFLLFLWIYALVHGEFGSGGALIEYGTEGDTTYFSVQFTGILLLILISFGVLFIHEGIHALGFRMFGGRPIVGAMVIQKILPAFYCSAPGYRFTKLQFSVIVLGPLVVISLVGIALMPFVNDGVLLVLPLAVNFGGAIGDIWMFVLTMRRPTGTMIEDLKDGIRFHYPSTA
jgi:hypothetical protein